MKDDMAVYSKYLKQKMRTIWFLPLRFSVQGHKLTRKRKIKVIVLGCRHIPWNKGAKIGWLLELQNLECYSSNLEIYSVTNRKPMQIRKILFNLPLWQICGKLLPIYEVTACCM